MNALKDKLPFNKRWIERSEFLRDLEKVFRVSGIQISKQIIKEILSSLSKRDQDAMVCKDAKGRVEADIELREHEIVPLSESWQEYMEREVKPFSPDAWVDEKYIDTRDGQVGRVGYEINFNRYFYKYVPQRPLDEIDKEIKNLEKEISFLFEKIVK